ncbi:hypothetical protein J31TS4_40470 [Paenibacillus sp. J31TS4]|uniref:VOC family protein n=1 Tax=Paenibacillus sp. J31TS4 TaxID=2807195 RepID=UPI001B1E51B2|nr:hypothetical protein [Paenibacillus sp. J31TS4]GIP40767.1 hypothetical protein J31TS4_40470 [Paenibacillus sp. J31TS4]
MSSPISRYMPAVFFPVSNLKRSIEWYADLLEMPIQPKQEGGAIYYFDFDGTDLILDSNAWGFPPTIMFDTQQIDEARSFAETLPHGFMSEVQRFPDVSFFNINSNMVCQASRTPQQDNKSKPAHRLLNRVSHVIAHAEDLQETVQWYETFLQSKTEIDPQHAELPYIRMDRGAQLLIDDNRLCQSQRVSYDRLQLELRVNPILILETGDIVAAMEYVRSKGIKVDDLEMRAGTLYFTFYDPDGNGLMVCEKPAM